jgi:hypothetical protein
MLTEFRTSPTRRMGKAPQRKVIDLSNVALSGIKVHVNETGTDYASVLHPKRLLHCISGQSDWEASRKRMLLRAVSSLARGRSAIAERNQNLY